MESVNESIKLIAQAKDIIHKLISESIITQDELNSVVSCLEQAIDKLAVQSST
jgi:transcriptional regulator CtsR